MKREVRHLTKRDHYAADYSTVVQQRDDDTTTTLAIRRVRKSGETKDELQIEITIAKHHEKRTTSAHSSFVVPAEIADVVGRACLEYHESERRPPGERA